MSQALRIFVSHSVQQAPPALSSSAAIPQIPGARRDRSCEMSLWTSSIVGGETGILGVGALHTDLYAGLKFLTFFGCQN